MNSIKSAIIAGASALLLAVTFNNCGQNGSITKDDISNKNVDVEVQNIIKNCIEANQQGKLLTLKQTINFQDSRVETGKSQICDFAADGKVTADGNLDQVEGQLRARYEQHQKLNLPDNAVICDIQMINNLQSFRYDDIFFFNFNNYLLATNDKTAVNQKLTPQRVSAGSSSLDLFTYDWSLLRTAGFQNVADDYCIGKDQGLAQCSWPITEEQGSIKFEFNPAILIRMSAQVPANNQTFSFVITGDNDPAIDCFHEKLTFDMDVKYYLKQ